MKMSDALRAAAETAPIEGISISAGAVRSRARRNRAVRAGANGIVGVGAAVLMFAGVAGVINGQTGLSAADADSGAKQEDTSGGMATNGGMEPGLVDPLPADTICGTTFDASRFATGEVVATASIDEPTRESATVSVEFTGSGAVAIDTTTYYVLWEGMVVSLYDGAGAQSSHADVPLVNCWDGAALPAGDYGLVTVSPVAPGTFAVSDAVAFTVAGDAMSDPFASYLAGPQPTDPPAPGTPSGMPPDTLTGDAARAAYHDALAGTWDMAAGTQRVVMTGDGADPGDATLWARNYFGCGMDGAAGAFPRQSATLDWLAVSATIPATLHVSYGWIVDGNPAVTYAITNTSSWAIPGYFASSGPHLVLVKDGRVAAEAYPINPQLSQGGIAYATGGAETTADAAPSAGAAPGPTLLAPPAEDFLAPGAGVSGDYVWRDVSGCWTDGNGGQVLPGTYTVLAAHDIYVGSIYAPDASVSSASSAGDTAGDTAGDIAVAPVVAPVPGGGDYASFTVWTSLGTVKVQN